MAIRIANKFASVIRIQPIADKLLEEFFASDDNGSYISYTGYTFTSSLYYSFNNLVASPTVTTSDAIPPDETVSVVDGKITIADIPANLPTKEGDYTLWVTRTKDDDATDVMTFLQMQISFIQKKYTR